MRLTTGLCAALMFAAAGSLSAPAATAQNQPSSPSTKTPGTTSPASIPDKKLDAAAAAVKKVSAVSNSYKDRIAKAPAADKERLIGEANDAMKKAVTDQGLSVEEYTSIVNVAQSDPAVRDKLLKRLQ
ncbi:DUF4168 domain-containing protein [Reyranella sp.]|jgi:hypothetical protein|uniref:DUF4168 domain-containing protein n=1 Tax=Reyranella sp. TaxID=1929291 RepID=UPI002F949970